MKPAWISQNWLLELANLSCYHSPPAYAQARQMGLYAAQGLAGGGDALGAGLTFELFSHATRFLGLKARRPRLLGLRAARPCACPAA